MGFRWRVGQRVVEFVLKERLRRVGDERRWRELDRFSSERASTDGERKLFQHLIAVPIDCEIERVGIRIAAHALRDREFLKRDIHRHAHELRLELHPHRILQIRMRACGEPGAEEQQTREDREAGEFHR